MGVGVGAGVAVGHNRGVGVLIEREQLVTTARQSANGASILKGGATLRWLHEAVVARGDAPDRHGARDRVAGPLLSVGPVGMVILLALSRLRLETGLDGPQGI